MRTALLHNSKVWFTLMNILLASFILNTLCNDAYSIDPLRLVPSFPFDEIQ